MPKTDMPLPRTCDNEFDDEKNEAPFFSRTGLDNPMGKLGKSFKTDVDFDTGADFERLCHEAGSTPAAMLRDHIYELMHGKTFTDICHDAAKVKRDKFFSKRPHGTAMGPFL